MGFFKLNQKGENNQAQEQTAKVFGGVSIDGKTIGNEVENTNHITFEYGSRQTTGEENIKETVKNVGEDEKKWQVSGEGKNLPTQTTMWTKIKSVLFKEIDLNREIVLELTPREEKFVQGMKDFWLQEVSFSGIKNIFKGKKGNKKNES